MKILPGRGAARALLITLAILAAALGVASFPWHAGRAPGPPRVVQAAAGAGPLRAGAAAAVFALPAEVPIGGFARLRYASEGEPEPVGARALVLAVPGCKVALVSAELLLVPEALEEAVRARVADLALDGLVLAATHTHAGPGGYWEHPAGERIATGGYDPRVRDAIATGIASAIRRADAALAPARAEVARGEAADLARSRSGGAGGGRLTALRVARQDGAPLAELVVFAAHPTILGQRNRRISGDWPGRFAAGGGPGIRLVFPGALGDQSVAGPESAAPERFAAALSARVAALPWTAAAPAARADPAGGRADLAFAAAEVALPDPAPGAAPRLLRRAAANLAWGMLPATARVEAVRLGDLVLAAVPAEPVAAVGAAWRAALPAGAEVVSLANGYVGYVEEPARVADGSGEASRTEYGPELARRLGDALAVAARTVAPGPGAQR